LQEENSETQFEDKGMQEEHLETQFEEIESNEAEDTMHIGMKRTQTKGA